MSGYWPLITRQRFPIVQGVGYGRVGRDRWSHNELASKNKTERSDRRSQILAAVYQSNEIQSSGVLRAPQQSWTAANENLRTEPRVLRCLFLPKL
jgi:hypothetical protein